LNGSSQPELAPQALSDFVWIPQAAGIAREAGALLREFFAKGVETEYKGDVDLVTVADRTAEKLIRTRLAEVFPEHGVYGEEGTRDRMEGEFRWYVDPLDGTTNFAHGFPQFCVSMGLEQRLAAVAPELDGTLVAGVIYDPMRDELYTAERGKGAWLNGKRIHVSRIPVLAESLVATGFPSRKRHESPNIHFYHEFTLRSHGVRRAGSAALDLAFVASGRLEAFWEFNLNPWDTAAGILLVEEAGGQITGFDGQPFQLNSREILASNGLIQDELVGLFRDMFDGRELSPIPTPQQFAQRRAERTAQAGKDRG
jgi:myo-inositol-1(or 4)-monophosphatase